MVTRLSALLLLTACTYTPALLQQAAITCEVGFQDNDGDGACAPGCDSIAWDAIHPEDGGCLDCDDSSGWPTCMCTDGPVTTDELRCRCHGVDCGEFGSCVAHVGWADCECDPGYQANGNHGCSPGCALADCLGPCDDSTGQAVCCILFVDPVNGSPGNTGTSWADAFRDIQAGIDRAATRIVEGGDLCQVWVSDAGGQVVVTDATITLAEGVAVVGGVPVDATSLRDRGDPWIARTRINRIYPNAYDPAFAAADRAELEGFQIEYSIGSHGTALSIQGVSNFHVTHMTFVGNAADVSGGAVLVAGSNGVAISACDFIDNQAPMGGALAIVDSAAMVSSGSFVNNRAEDGEGLGGAIHSSGSTLGIYNTIFTRNRALRGGAINAGFTPEDAVHLEGVTISDCDAIYDGVGGAIAVSGAQLTLTRATLSSNTSSGGGAVFVDDSELLISNSLLVANSNAAVDVRGDASQALIASTTIAGNTTQGPALRIEGGVETTLVNSVFEAQNGIANAGVTTVAYSIIPATPCAGCTLAASVHQRAPGFRAPHFSGTADELATEGGVTVIDVGERGWSDGMWANMMLRTEDGWQYPILANTGDTIWVIGSIEGLSFDILDYHLDTSSPGLDAADGDNAPAVDMLFRMRFDVPGVDNTGTGAPPFADMGCFESIP